MSELGDENEDHVLTEEQKIENSQQLIDSCMKNDTQKALLLIQEGTDIMYETENKWSALTWAACNGNETLVRVLLHHGASEIYMKEENLHSSILDSTEGESVTESKKEDGPHHSPLHWAAFKGHLLILNLLIGNEGRLNIHSTDYQGSTLLHHAAASNNYEIVFFLLTQGVSSFAKNLRGHYAFDLSTEKETTALLTRSFQAKECKATKKQFSYETPKYLCARCKEFFCLEAITRTTIYHTSKSLAKEIQATYHHECYQAILNIEARMSTAISSNNLPLLLEVLEEAKTNPVDKKLYDACIKMKDKISATIQIEKALQIPSLKTLKDYFNAISHINEAVEFAKANDGDVTKIEMAITEEHILTLHVSVIKILLLLLGPDYASLPLGEEGKWEMNSSVQCSENLKNILTTSVRELQRKVKVIEQLKTDSNYISPSYDQSIDILTRSVRVLNTINVSLRIGEMQRRLLFCKGKSPAVLNAIAVEEREKKGIPQWYYDQNEFQGVIKEVRVLLRDAKAADIPASFVQGVQEILSDIEQQLVTIKQTEEELKLKAARKKYKSPVAKK